MVDKRIKDLGQSFKINQNDLFLAYDSTLNKTCYSTSDTLKNYVIGGMDSVRIDLYISNVYEYVFDDSAFPLYNGFPFKTEIDPNAIRFLVTRSEGFNITNSGIYTDDVNSTIYLTKEGVYWITSNITMSFYSNSSTNPTLSLCRIIAHDNILETEQILPHMFFNYRNYDGNMDTINCKMSTLFCNYSNDPVQLLFEYCGRSLKAVWPVMPGTSIRHKTNYINISKLR